MAKEVYEYRLPMYLACYIFNADAEGLTEDERTRFDAFCERENVHFVGMVEGSEGFYHRNDFENLGADCATFQAFKND